MALSISLITPAIARISAESLEQLCETMMRFQEHYESPEFKGRFFSTDEYLDWYAKTYEGGVYTEDWGGFNFPEHILEPFADGRFGELSALEQELLSLMGRYPEVRYIVGVQPDGEAMEHEICHALYYTEPQYRLAVDFILVNNYHALIPVYQELHEMGYHEDVIADEAHAYLSADPSYLDSSVGLESISDQLRQVYNDFVDMQNISKV